MATVESTSASKLSEDDELFLRDQWSAVEGYGASMASAGGITVTAKENGETVAVAKGWHAGGVAQISELMVHADHRNKGLGAQVLQHFERSCIGVGARRLALRVESNNPALRFYEREGWRVELSIEDWLDGHTYLQLRKDL